MKSLKEWLKGYYTPSGQPYTHVSLSGGRYCIPDDQLEQLYELLESSSEIYHLAEKRPEKASNITIDFDLIVKDISLETNHCFDIDFITRVVDLYNSHLFEMGLCHNMYICTYVLYRDSAYCDSKMNTYKDGFHLHYTDFLLDYELQYELRERVVNDLKLCDWMFPTVNSIEGVVDKMAISNHWLLYGCSKPGLQPYKAQYIIYGHQNEKSKLELVPPEFNKNYLINCFSLRNLKAKHLEQPSQPAILLPSDLNLETSEDYVHNLNTVNQIYEIEDEEGYQLIEEALNYLKNYRCDNYHDWILVGWILFNCCQDRIRAFKIYLKWSKKSSHYYKGCCQRVFKNARPANSGQSLVRLGSLVSMIAQDKIDGYLQICSQLQLSTLSA